MDVPYKFFFCLFFFAFDSKCVLCEYIDEEKSILDRGVVSLFLIYAGNVNRNTLTIIETQLIIPFLYI